MKKKLIVLLSMIFLVACQSVPQKELKEKVTLTLFYVSTCSDCKAFKKNAIPYIEKVYGDSVEIKQYDLDDEKTEKVYDQVVNSLEDFDEEYYGTAPFIVLNGYFAVLGYTSGDEKYLADDIEKAVKHQELGLELSRRMYFK